MPLADNEKMEDFSLRYTPSSFRKWSPWMVFLTCMVGMSAMAGYALDAAYVNGYGFGNAVLGFGVATAFTVPLTLTIAFSLARHHIDIDLLTRAALGLAGLLVLLSQLKINIMNTYSGSLSWSNFFSRVLHRHPGRAVWTILQCALALVLMEMNIFAHIVTVLGWYSNVAIAWIGV